MLGLALLIALFVRADYAAMLHVAGLAGWRLLWLAPYRAVYFLLYALGWLALLRPYDPQRRAGLGYVGWVTTVREGIDRLLPVAGIGGAIAGVRLLHWRGLAIVPVSATVIVEVLLTLVSMYVFTVLGLVLLTGLGSAGTSFRHMVLALLASLPVPVITALLLRYGSVFARSEGVLRSWIGLPDVSGAAAALDRELRACLHRTRTLLLTASLQLLAFASGSLEIWFVLRLFGHPIDLRAALILESLMQALRHLAFFVPAGLGVQEAALVLFGHALGVSTEMALAVSLAKRMRELLCGLPALISWQVLEARRLRTPCPKAS